MPRTSKLAQKGRISPTTVAANDIFHISTYQNLLYLNENPNLDQYLNIDTLPEGGLQVKVVYKTNSANVLVRTPRDEKTKSLVRQICDKNWHAAANTVTNHSELYPEVLNAVNKKASNEMSEYLKSESMLLCNKPDEITGFSNPVFLEEFCPVVYYLVLGASGIQESDVMHLSMLSRWGGRLGKGGGFDSNHRPVAGFFDRFNGLSSNILLTFSCYFDNPQCPGVGHLNGNSQLSSNPLPLPGLPPSGLILIGALKLKEQLQIVSHFPLQ